ncbi:hypothetical protein [Micromonospora tulbaghiae]|uniref:hypothetical protein n=1 Tax=Micromonospora tulbaghiae TaxID=479978 RepID=UPI00343682AF
MSSTRSLFLALIFVIALLVASWTGFLVWITNRQTAFAILQAGVAFAGTAGLCLATWGAIRQR